MANLKSPYLTRLAASSISTHQLAVIHTSPTLQKLIVGQLRSLLIVALVLSLGVGTTVIQVVAWATMIPTQLAKTGSVSQAVENTFSGDHACPMCEIAAVKRDAEETPAPLSPETEKKKAKSTYTICHLSQIRSYPPRKEPFPFPRSSLRLTSLAASPDFPPPQLLS